MAPRQRSRPPRSSSRRRLPPNRFLRRRNGRRSGGRGAGGALRSGHSSAPSSKPRQGAEDAGRAGHKAKPPHRGAGRPPTAPRSQQRMTGRSSRRGKIAARPTIQTSSPASKAAFDPDSPFAALELAEGRTGKAQPGLTEAPMTERCPGPPAGGRTQRSARQMAVVRAGREIAHVRGAVGRGRQGARQPHQGQPSPARPSRRRCSDDLHRRHRPGR